MYYIGEDNSISITRGDSAYIKLDIFDSSGLPYVKDENDIVRVQVRTMKNTGNLVFEGQVDVTPENEFVWHIRPEDTRGLPVRQYFYDAQLETSNGDIFTFIPASNFKLLDEVTLDGRK